MGAPVGQPADVINGRGGDDVICGDRDRATVGQDDVLSGGPGHDTPSGDDGTDNLFGEAGSDRLSGGGGFDVLDGGLDADQCDPDFGQGQLIDC